MTTRTAGLEDRAQAVEDFSRQRGEFRTSMIDDRLIHRAQDPIGNVGGTGDLKEVPARMPHGYAVYTVRLAAALKPAGGKPTRREAPASAGSDAARAAGMIAAQAHERERQRRQRRAPSDPRTARHRAAPRAAGRRRRPAEARGPDRSARAERAAQHQPKHRPRSAPSAIRSPISLVRCATDVGGDAVQSDRREQQRHDAEERRPGSRPRVPDRTIDRTCCCMRPHAR